MKTLPSWTNEPKAHVSSRRSDGEGGRPQPPDAPSHLRRCAGARLVELACFAAALTVAGCSSGSGEDPTGAGGGASGGASSSSTSSSTSPSDKICEEATHPSIDILDSDGHLDPAAYRKIAGELGNDQGIHYRYGPDSSCWHSQFAQFPSAYRPLDRICPVPGNYGSGFMYQVGAEQCTTDPGDYSSTQAALLFSADEPTNTGVEEIQILSMVSSVFISKPRESWTYSIASQKVDSDAWKTLNGGVPPTSPVAAARAVPGAGELNMNALVAFNSGFIGAWGENTANNDWAMKLPDHKVPTAIAITNGSEFALVTVWDTEALVGQIAVIALDSAQPGLWDYAFKKPYPGLQNCGNYTSGKLLGFIDLPDMHAPTEISAVSNRQQSWWTKDGANTLPGSFDFSVESDRQSFVSGENKGKYSTAGFATVISRSEKKATFIDLQPLFQYYSTMYFGTVDDFNKTQDLGPETQKWPHGFDVAPESRPLVVSTVDIGDFPTAVLNGAFGNADTTKYYGALIATMGGSLDIYDVGGLIDESAADAAQIHKIGSIPVGHNPTKIAYRKSHAWAPPDPVSNNPENVMKNEVYVVARGDREIEFVEIYGGTGAIYKRITDSALVDPISAEDADNHGTESYVLTVADHAGRQFVNYRFGPIIYHTNGGAVFGMGADGKADLELGGTFAVPGKAFFVSGANVP